jgi:hypothetical protein
MYKENTGQIGEKIENSNEGIAQNYFGVAEPNNRSQNGHQWDNFIQTSHDVIVNAKRKSKAEVHVKMLVDHLIRWSQDHQASITASVKGLCEGTLTKRTASSLRAILAAYQPETFLVASELLTKVEEHYGPVPDVLSSADAILTRHGFVLNAVFTNGITGTLPVGGAA